MTMRTFAAAVVAFQLFAVPAPAQEPEAKTISFVGPEIVCHILHSLGMKPIKTLEDAVQSPKQTVIMVFGDPRILDDIRTVTGGLRRFLDRGGNLLIATDHALDHPDLPIRISGNPVRTSKDHAYRGETQCPWLYLGEPDIVTNKLARDHPVFSFLRKGIATNRPSDVALLENDGTTLDLHKFPFDLQALHRGRQLIYIAGSLKDAPSEGRALYIAGHGMFMNGMMVQTDNDNFDFTVNAVRWLRETANGKQRTQVLFVVDGAIITDFDMKLTPPAPPIPLPPVRALDRLIRGLEKEHLFQRMLDNALGDWRTRFIGILLGLATFVLLLYGAKKMMEGRHHLETAVPNLLTPDPANDSHTPIEQRQQSMIRQGDFWQESRHLTLEWFSAELGVTPDRWRAEVKAGFQAEGSFWGRRRLQQQANETLHLARSAEADSVSRHQFFMLLETLRDLSDALKDGRLALLVEGKNVRQG